MRIVVGMSGGVDSSVAALMLKREGHDVIGVFMNNWEEKDESGVCTSERDWADVRRVCDAIKIPYYAVNFANEYRERVFGRFLDEYRRGRTPNPDVLCNREIKFSAFLDFAEKLGADRLATGHFARIGRDGAEYTLLRSADENKDQTYFLYMISQRALSRALFPVGGLVKGEVREIARAAGLPVSEKKDSTGICFIGERNFKRFLMQYLPAQPGDMVTQEGKIVGRHDGLMYYTLGQRRGLGIGGVRESSGESWFVIGKDMERNLLIVQQGEHEEIFSLGLTANKMSYIEGEPPAKEFECTAKFRYRQADSPVHIKVQGEGILVDFLEPERAVTPGQWVVLYDGEVCLGGGPIDETRPLKKISLNF